MGFREFLHWLSVKCPNLTFLFEPFRRPVRILIRRIHYRHIVAASRSTQLEFIQAAETERNGKTVALMSVRNEIDRLSACLEYHRHLGVSEFCIVDNGSTDGSLEFLKAQRDVNLYRTNESYKQAYYGITWINFLFHKHAKGRWALFIDADELLYLNREDCKIDQYVELLSGIGQSYLYAPMVDLYLFDDEKVKSVGDRRDLDLALKESMHDVDGYEPGPLLSNGFLSLKGGPRGRIAQKTGGAQPLLVKFPLIRYDERRYFTASSHEFMPDSYETHIEQGWLIHLKLGTQMARRHSDPEIEREHYGAGEERTYLNSSQDVPRDATARRFDGLRTLACLRSKIVAEGRQ
ncbi:glycosyltransferase family 2 protein [Brucella intermedia]|uniref:glycosyltransferase family 2 protein n=2 Tax=Brucella intermedia TaxID=94625 RepID=UPI00209A845E|nr:glycosyltransferase family 2 protein [Brucella intermedia]MCO7728841.1 glycosyltransferase family 2 protein [Brucella intermedia]WLF97143.1 glycosyltransferase family 2 protein [Brucella intermedia]